jgi:hypothetical protein
MAAPLSCYSIGMARNIVRKVCGVRAMRLPGVKLDPTPDQQYAVNVGSVLGSPFPADDQSVDGQVHHRLMARGRGRAFVVVRARESRAHGEGRQ